MRHDIDGARLKEELGANAERPEISVEGFLEGTEDVGRREVVRSLGVAEVSLHVEGAELLRGVDREAVVVGIVVNLGAVADGIAVTGTNVERNAQNAAASSRVVKAKDGAVDVGFIAGIRAVEALGFVGCAEDVDPRRHADFTASGVEVRDRRAAIKSGDNFVLVVESSGESAAFNSHVRRGIFSLHDRIDDRGKESLFFAITLFRRPFGTVLFRVLIPSLFSRLEVRIGSRRTEDVEDEGISNGVAEFHLIDFVFDDSLRVESE